MEQPSNTKFLSATKTGKYKDVRLNGHIQRVFEYLGARGGTYYFNHCYFGAPIFDVYNRYFKKIATVNYGELIEEGM